jgi:hypothetical protein
MSKNNKNKYASHSFEHRTISMIIKEFRECAMNSSLVTPNDRCENLIGSFIKV